MAEQPNIALQPIEETYTFDVFSEAIKKMFTESNADVYFTFSSNEKGRQRRKLHINAHKMLLSAISPVFAAMFDGRWKETTAVNMADDATFDGFNTFLQYFYTNKITLNNDNVVEVLNLANKYDIPDLKASCGSFLLNHMEAENVIECLSLAHTFGLMDLATKSIKCISNNTIDVLKSDEFLECTADVLHKILSIESTLCTEVQIFDACIEWARAKCLENSVDDTKAENLRTTLARCFDLIRFNEMEPDARNDRVTRYKDMFSKDEILMILTQQKPPLTRCRELYAFEFTRSEMLGGSFGYSFPFRLSHPAKFVAFSMLQSSVDRVFGKIADNFTGTANISVYPSHGVKISSSNYQFKRSKNRDTDRDYCFQLVTAFVIHPNFHYSINVEPRAYPASFIVMARNLNQIALIPRIGTLLNYCISYLAGLYFDRCDDDDD